MTTLHAPQRLDGESRTQYAARRIQSKLACRLVKFGLENTGRFVQSTNPKKKARKALASATFPKSSGQNPIALTVRHHKPKAAIKPTWPHSVDQRKQSRPLIIMSPLKQLKAAFPVTKNIDGTTSVNQALALAQTFAAKGNGAVVRHIARMSAA